MVPRWWRLRGGRLIGAVTVFAVVLAVVFAGVGVLAWPPDVDIDTGAEPSTTEPSTTGPAPETAGAPRSDSVASASPAPADLPAPAPGSGPLQLPTGGTARSLVRTAQLTVAVDDAGAATRAVRTAAATAGGVVVEEQTTDGGSWLVLRVPADRLDRVLDDVAAVGRVTGRSSQVVDSTADVVDLDARVASQQASVVRVRSLLAQAVSVGDVVAIESELARREADLDSLTGRLAALRDQVALSTLTVDLRTPGTPPPIDEPRAAGFLGGLATGWDGLRALGTAVAAVLGFVLPFVPVLAVLAGTVWLARRLARARERSGSGSVGEP